MGSSEEDARTYAKLELHRTTPVDDLRRAWLALAVGLTLAAPTGTAAAQDDDIRFLPARCASVRGYHLLEQAFPQDVFASRVIFAVERPDGPLTAPTSPWSTASSPTWTGCAQDEPDLQIGKVDSHRDPSSASACVSARPPVHADPGVAGHARTWPCRRGPPWTAPRPGSASALAEAGATAPRLYATGPAGIGRDLIAASASSLDGTTLATVAPRRRRPAAGLPRAAAGPGAAGHHRRSVWVALNLLAL